MKRATLDSMASAVSFDVETWPIQPGLLAPPLVCASAAALDESTGRIQGELLDKDGAEELFATLLDSARVITGANLPYDLAVMAVRLLARGIDPMPEIFKMLVDEGRAFDIQTSQMLDAIAEGCLGMDPDSGGPLVSPETGRRAGYSLSVVTKLVTGREDAKVNDEWRTKYHLLDGKPFSEWPENAKVYPVDDAINTEEDALAQVGILPRAGAHRWGANLACEWCGMLPKDAYKDGQRLLCRTHRRARNLHDLSNQVATAFAMHLGAMWGFDVDQASVDAVERDALNGRAEAEEPFVAAGLLRRNSDGTTTRDMSAIARAVALAYGADTKRPCKCCQGTRKVISPKAKPVKCPACKGAKQFADPQVRGGVPCFTCSNQGQIPNPKQLVNCTDCGATGLDLDAAPNLPKTDTGRVGTGRDVLNESGSEVLMALADHMEDAKVLQTYVPALRRARRPVAGHADACAVHNGGEDCTCPGPYTKVALTLWPNVLLETGRTSYRGIIQLLPRKKGHWTVYVHIVEVPADYVLQPGEVFV